MGHELRIFFNNKQKHGSKLHSVNPRNGAMNLSATSK